MSLLDIRKVVVDAFEAAPQLQGVSIKPHGGRFDFLELDNYAVTAPEIRIAVLRAARLQKGRNLWDANVAAYVITGADRHLLASERGLAIGSAAMAFLAGYVPANQGNPENIVWQNLYSAESRERNKHLSAITWSQTVDLSGLAETALNPFLKLAITYDLAPVDGKGISHDNVQLPPPEAP